MKRMLIQIVLVSSLATSSVFAEPVVPMNCMAPEEKQVFVHEPTSSYTRLRMHGFTVRVSAAAMRNISTTQPALDVLEKKLAEVIRLMPEHTHNHLREVVIWMEHNAPEHDCACYHPDKQWLIENGFNPDKEKGIEIANPRNFVSWVEWGQPMMVLHELAHAYHDTVLGFDNELINSCFEHAKASGKYDEVEHVLGYATRHYALTNAREYFAELTESYFKMNDFEPFTRSKLEAFDPRGFEMIEAMWLRPVDEE